jgi:two-component system chemotaxis sensor kinase CheA
MTPLLEQFISEARECLQGIAEKLLQLEKRPVDSELMNELFRLVHTLKGNSGLFEFPDMTRVLHAGEDLLDTVRDGRVLYSQALADRLLDAMDFVNLLLDEIEIYGQTQQNYAQDALRLADSLRQLIVIDVPVKQHQECTQTLETQPNPALSGLPTQTQDWLWLLELPEDQRMSLYREICLGAELLLVDYQPEAECFFKGEDPFYQIKQIPEVVWSWVQPRCVWTALAELDAYHCNLHFKVITTVSTEQIQDLFRYTLEQIKILSIPAVKLVLPQGEANGGPVYEDFVTEASAYLDAGDLIGLENVARTLLELSAPVLWLSSLLRWLLLVLKIEPANQALLRALILSLRTFQPPNGLVELMGVAKVFKPVKDVDTNTNSDIDYSLVADIINLQREILALSNQDAWLAGRLRAVVATLMGCYRVTGHSELLPELEAALATALSLASSQPLLAWLDSSRTFDPALPFEMEHALETAVVTPNTALAADAPVELKFGRRAEDAYNGPKTLKVEQEKIDRLMNLIGEMVVAKNSLPYLAGRAEIQYGSRELSREIKNQYAVINRIAEEMQDTIMQVRMMPVSFVFQRFPRLVRDTSRKLGKEVNLILEGEETEADKNIVEALADPLIHIIRNSLDHGIELPEIRRAAGKLPVGKLSIRASQESDRVNIEIRDDGKGIDPEVIKRKAYEKGIIDEATMERLNDQEAINLIFAAGFSTAEVVSDLSGRGVGMDVVRHAVEKVNGVVNLDSELGKGTCIQLSLPLSMAVTNVIIIESNQQIFGVPMDMVVETVRVPTQAIRKIKNHLTTVLRGRIVPLLGLNALLGLDVPAKVNSDDELATLVIRINEEPVGILVDNFRETVDIILKPMTGILGSIHAYAGSALLGDGSVLMVLNPRELV